MPAAPKTAQCHNTLHGGNMCRFVAPKAIRLTSEHLLHEDAVQRPLRVQVSYAMLPTTLKSLEERLVSSRTYSPGDSRNSADKSVESHISPLEWQLEFGPRLCLAPTCLV